MITSQVSDELYRTFGVSVPPQTYDSEKGDIGAVLRRMGIPSNSVGLAVHLATENGCYTIEPESPLPITPDVRNRGRPQQLTFGLDVPYDPMLHLRPDGRKKRKR